MKVILAGKDKKIQELQGNRDIFGRLLYLAEHKGVDLDLVFRYPLTPITLCHVDVSINKKDKAKLMHKL